MFWFLCGKKSVFAFCFLKHVALTQKTRFGLLAVKFVLLLQRGKGFLPVCSNSPCFFLDFTQKNVFSSVWLSDNGF